MPYSIRVSRIATRSSRAARRYPVGAAALTALVAMGLAAIFAGQFAPYDPLAHNEANALLGPSSEHFFGTDRFGRDVFSRVLHGARVSLMVGLVSVLAGTVIGTTIGIISAYASGVADLIIQRFIDALMAFPHLLMALLLVTVLEPSPVSVIIGIVVAFVPQVARIARAQALAVKAETYVMAAKSLGGSPTRIVVRHVLPNSIAPVVIHATGFMEGAVLTEAALSFLGLGVPPPDPSWGRMLKEGSEGFLEAAPWLTVFPGLALTALVFCVALIGDGLRDFLDPRQR